MKKECEEIKITSNNILETIRIDSIEAFMFAESGAMGRPGELKYFCIEAGKLLLYRGNRFDKEINDVTVNNLFTKLHNKAEWFHVNLGMGNHLCMKPKYQNEFEISRKSLQEHIYKVYEIIILDILCKNTGLTNYALQDALIEHYVSSNGLITEEDLNSKTFEEWKSLISLLFNQSLSLNREDWNNPTELKEVSNNNVIWDTIREIYKIVGQVKESPLKINNDIVCLSVAYAIKSLKNRDKKISTEESFRLKFESFIAREIITQREKSKKVIEDELLDRDYIRSLRRRNACKFQCSSEGDIQKIDFARITLDGYKKVYSIADCQYKYEEYIDDNDEKLSENYILFSFEKIGNDIYAKSWAHVLAGLGLNPTNKGIEYLAKRIDIKMKDVIYECFFEQRFVSPKTIICMRFYQELYKILKEILDEKQIRKSLDKNEWDENSILYIYKNKTSCHTRKHEMVSATAILTGRNNSEIKLNVEYCLLCKKFYMSYTVYEAYREKYGMLLGKLRMDSASTAEVSDVILSEYSPLKLNGYSVNQQDGYSRKDRQYILSKVIEKGALLKSEVLRYLEYFINMNGRRSGNEIALSKWKEDLEFVLQYKMTEQDEYEIKHIKKY